MAVCTKGLLTFNLLIIVLLWLISAVTSIPLLLKIFVKFYVNENYVKHKLCNKVKCPRLFQPVFSNKSLPQLEIL